MDEGSPPATQRPSQRVLRRGTSLQDVNASVKTHGLSIDINVPSPPAARQLQVPTGEKKVGSFIVGGQKKYEGDYIVERPSETVIADVYFLMDPSSQTSGPTLQSPSRPDSADGSPPSCSSPLHALLMPAASLDRQKVLYLPHGKGRLTTRDGEVLYDGDWRRGFRDGFGRASVEGGSYEGEWHQGQRSGKGVLRKGTSGATYEGEWRGDKREGFGILTGGGGSGYSGEWVAGKKQGRGRFVVKGRFEYNGEFVDGEREGLGLCSFADGSIYAGGWKCGKREGGGRFVEASTQRRYVGEWVGDVRSGRGKLTDGSGNVVYEGGWYANQRNGEGKFVDADGAYEGEWFLDLKHGHGTPPFLPEP
jgi:hypothetical protein